MAARMAAAIRRVRPSSRCGSILRLYGKIRVEIGWGKFKHSRACRWARHQEWDGGESGSTGLFKWRGLGGDWGGDGSIAQGDVAGLQRLCRAYGACASRLPRTQRLRAGLTFVAPTALNLTCVR